MTQRDLTSRYEDDGRVFVDPGEGDQLFSQQLLDQADSRWLRVEDDRIIMRGRNGTWTYQIDGSDRTYGATNVKAHLIESSNEGTDERFVFPEPDAWLFDADLTQHTLSEQITGTARLAPDGTVLSLTAEWTFDGEPRSHVWTFDSNAEAS